MAAHLEPGDEEGAIGGELADVCARAHGVHDCGSVLGEVPIGHMAAVGRRELAQALQAQHKTIHRNTTREYSTDTVHCDSYSTA